MDTDLAGLLEVQWLNLKMDGVGWAGSWSIENRRDLPIDGTWGPNQEK